MEVTFITSRMFETTRSLVTSAAHHPELQVRLVRGDADPVAALRAMQTADRIWFEGAGPCLRDLVRRDAAGWLVKACLRIAPEEIDAVPVPDVWRLVAEVLVPTREAARRARERLRPPTGVAVGVASRLEELQAAVLRHAGDLRSGAWTAVLQIADACRGRVRLRGDPPDQLARFLEVAHGLEVVRDGPAETVIHWEPRPAPADPVCRIARTSDAPAPESLTPPGPDPSAGPLVSAVVPVWNGADTIDRCLRSLRRQTWPNLEIVVIDDGSTDSTAEVVGAHLSDPRVHYFDKPHSGRPETRNLGVEKSRGEWIAWLDADDVAMPNRIAAQMAAAEDAGGADVVHCDALFMEPDGSVSVHRRYASLEGPDVPARFLAGLAAACPVLNTSAAVRRDLYDRLGGYDPAFPRCQDYEFYVRAVMAGGVRFCHVPAPLVQVYRGRHSPERLHRILGYYHELALRLIKRFGPAALADPVARDLHEPPQAAVARHLVAAALAFQAPRGHPMLADAEGLLREAINEARGPSRQTVWKLLSVAAEARGRSDEAAAYLARAKGAVEASTERPETERVPEGSLARVGGA